jgi:integrase
LDTPLVRIIRPDDTTALGNCYLELAKKRKDDKGRVRGGPGVAARVFRNFRAVWNTARRSYPALLAYPTGVVNLSSGERKRSPIPWGVLPKWAEAVDAIENGVRRDLQWFMLLTGARAASARTLRWENVRIRRGTIHFPKPKGGEDRAYTVPASRWLLDLLAKRRLANRKEYRNCPWVFPTRNRAGEVVPVQVAHQDVYETSTDEAGEKQKTKAHFFTYRNERGEVCNASPHRLRDTFATACKASKVDRFTTKLLMNHALPAGDVTDAYMGGDDEHTRACVERIAAFLLNKAGKSTDAKPPLKIVA